jgi:hypothetical protein
MEAHRMLHNVKKALNHVDKPKKVLYIDKNTGESEFFRLDNTGSYAQYAIYVRLHTRGVRLVVYYEEELLDYALDVLSSSFTIEQGKTTLEYDKNGWEIVISRPHRHK